MSSAQSDGQNETNGAASSTTAATNIESMKATATAKPTEVKTKLSNGFSEAHLESSVDQKASPERPPLVEADSTVNQDDRASPNSSPIASEKASRQMSHEREDSSSSLGGETDTLEQSPSQFHPVEPSASMVSGQMSKGDMQVPESSSQLESSTSLSSNHSSTRNGKGGVPAIEGDLKASVLQSVTSETVVAYSPGGRFLKYDVEIGRGSFKTVYKGLDTETGVAVAWCELQEKRYNKSEQARFKEEVAILKTLQHPNILKLYDSWESTGHRTEKKDKMKDKVLVLVTELMTSGTLKSYMRRLKSIKPKVIRHWGRQILKGLQFLHTRKPPIIHRDLKCDNIFINGTTGLVKIGDLGLATLKRNDVTTVIGTPEFMAPEMYEESYDESVDVYAFGMCLLEMCTLEYPYMECSNPAQIYKRVSQGIKPRAIDKVKNHALRDIIEKCTTVHKAQRFTVSDLLNHEYFSENLKIETVPGSEPADTQPAEPLLTMRMDVPNQESSKKNGQESIEFPYDLTKDVPEDVVGEMVKSGILHNSVQQMVSRSLREYVEGVKQKYQGRNKADNTNADVKIPEMKSEAVSHSPSPATANETPPTDSEQPSAQVPQRQPSTSTEPSKSEEGGVSKEPVQGLDMTGQGAMPAPSERERNLPLNVNKTQTPLPKTVDLLSPVSTSTSQPFSEHAPSTGQQITASTGQAVPQPGVARDSGYKSQSVSTSSEPKSYSSVVKESLALEAVSGPSSEKPSLDTSQESGHLKSVTHTESVLSTPLQEIQLQSDNSTESTPIHQPPHGESESSVSGMGGRDKMGSLKKKPPRHKTKGIKLLFKNYNSETKTIVCQLTTSNGKILEYKFSITYDKPEEMYRRFVKLDYLTEQDKAEFIRQSNELIQSVKKGRDSKTEPQESKPINLGIQEQGRSRASVEPALSPPSETAESAPKLSTEQVLQNDPRSSKSVHFGNGSPKLEPSKTTSEHQRTESVTSDTMVAPDTREVSNPLSSSSGTSVGVKSQPPVESVSTLVTHTAVSQDPQPAVQSLPNPQIAGVPPSSTGLPAPSTGVSDNLSSCSVPSLGTAQFPAGLPVCQPSSQPSSSTSIYPQPVQVTNTAPPNRVFEVETVAEEDKPDSPEMSDISASASTENLGRETQRSNSQESNPPASKKFVVQSVPSLESKSDSYIGKDLTAIEPLNNKPPVEQTVPVNPQAPPQQPQERSKSPRNYSLPSMPLQRATRPPGHSSRIPEHYCTTSILETGPTRQRGGITEETYVPPAYRHHASSSMYPVYPSSEGDAMEYEAQPLPGEHPLNIDELPQAGLLSEAFMRFMHSMSMVFRDPTFQPLMVSLDRRFGSQPLAEPGSAPPLAQHRAPQQEAFVSRSVTDPVVLPESGPDEELRVALEKIQEEHRKLEKKRQKMIEDFQKRKHSSGNSSLESSSGFSESRKVSTTSYDSVSIQSPPQGRRFARLNEYEGVNERLHEVPSTVTAAQRPNSTSVFSEMERRVKEGLTADKLRSGMSSPSHYDPNPLSRSRTPQFQGLPVTTTKACSSYTVPSEHGGSISPSLQTSPPPTQTLGQSTFQMQTSPSSSSMYQVASQSRYAHSDSNEWTEYTSAPAPQQAGGHVDNRTSVSQPLSRGSGGKSATQTSSSRADVSEFDPIANAGHRPKS